MMDFTGKQVIVTGANRSIGRCIALKFAELGANVVISYRSDRDGADETLRLLKQYSNIAAAFYADFSEQENVKHFFEEAIQFLGGVDILINNAGMSCRERTFELGAEKMQQVFQINSIAPLYLAQLCAKQMQTAEVRGSIVNISSIAGLMTMSKGIGYAASKAAMNKWTQNMALDLAPDGIRVNAVAPGVIAAGMNQDTATTNPELWRSIHEKIPLGRTGKPEDICAAVLFLASANSAFITGQVLTVDGGHSL